MEIVYFRKSSFTYRSYYLSVSILIILFIIGNILIILESYIKINKAAISILLAVLIWGILFNHSNLNMLEPLHENFLNNLGDIGAILFFMLGAMTIVDVVDTAQGFLIIRQILKVKTIPQLLFLITIITFFLSAIIDNLTTAIVMITIIKHFISERKVRLYFASIIIIAANAGGAWSPLGDITTTMLWIGGQISPFSIISTSIVPSLVCCLIPYLFISFKLRKTKLELLPKKDIDANSRKMSIIYLVLALFLFFLIPVFKELFNMPPVLGMLFALAFIWIATALLNLKYKSFHIDISISHALRRIDTESILFFLGILLSVAAMEQAGILENWAHNLQKHLSIGFQLESVLGFISGFIDNVPLMAAAQSMFSITQFPKDHLFWHLLALTTGTGGSIIVIGSAAGVAAMGLEKINFLWYLKKISWLALIGYICGILTFLLIN